MNPKTQAVLIPLDRIAPLVQVEAALVILGFALGSFLIYRFFLRDVSRERHERMRSYLLNVGTHLLVAGACFALFHLIMSGTLADPTQFWVRRVASWIGLITILAGTIAVLKTCRILVYEYLVLGHMKVGVPMLLVNLATLLLSLVLGGWILSEIFAIRLAPLLATSAIFSLVLGLALQDTLGNLFAGIALQMDKPYEIGDWIEVTLDGQQWVGQVDEISWRATILIAIGDEPVTIPNRIMAQSKISNFSARIRPFVRTQNFRIPYGTSARKVKEILTRAATQTPGVLSTPAPLAIVRETTESWYLVRLVYFINQYGQQYLIGDELLTRAMEELDSAGVSLAAPRIVVHPPNTSGDKTPPIRAS